MDYIDDNRVNVIYQIPLAEIVFDFFDKLKSSTRGYASFDARIVKYRPSAGENGYYLLNGDKVDAPQSLSFTRTLPTNVGNSSLINLKSHPRQQFQVPIQAAIDTRLSLVLISRPFVRT